MNLRTVRERMMFPPLGHGRYGAGEWDPDWVIPSGREILNAARKSQDAFLDRLIASPLYRRMVGGAMTGRSVAAMYGAGLGPDETPHVEQTVDGEEYMVDVDLTPAADIMLQALAAALWNLRPCSRSGRSSCTTRAPTSTRRGLAVRELLGNRKVREALTIRLTPDAAEKLRDALDDAAYPPDQCHEYDQGDPCRNYAAPGERQCPRHLPADLVEEYHL
jgi:hypothetical protein